MVGVHLRVNPSTWTLWVRGFRQSCLNILTGHFLDLTSIRKFSMVANKGFSFFLPTHPNHRKVMMGIVVGCEAGKALEKATILVGKFMKENQKFGFRSKEAKDSHKS